MNIGLQHSWQMYAMAVIVGFVTVMVMRRWRYRRAGTGGDSSLLSLVINNMTQGVILFDAHERILVCNDRYIEMYGLSPDVIKPGCTLLGLIEHRITTGSLNIDPAPACFGSLMMRPLERRDKPSADHISVSVTSPSGRDRRRCAGVDWKR